MNVRLLSILSNYLQRKLSWQAYCVFSLPLWGGVFIVTWQRLMILKHFRLSEGFIVCLHIKNKKQASASSQFILHLIVFTLYKTTCGVNDHYRLLKGCFMIFTSTGDGTWKRPLTVFSALSSLCLNISNQTKSEGRARFTHCFLRGRASQAFLGYWGKLPKREVTRGEKTLQCAAFLLLSPRRGMSKEKPTGHEIKNKALGRKTSPTTEQQELRGSQALNLCSIFQKIHLSWEVTVILQYFNN